MQPMRTRQVAPRVAKDAAITLVTLYLFVDTGQDKTPCVDMLVFFSACDPASPVLLPDNEFQSGPPILGSHHHQQQQPSTTSSSSWFVFSAFLHTPETDGLTDVLAADNYRPPPVKGTHSIYSINQQQQRVIKCVWNECRHPNMPRHTLPEREQHTFIIVMF